MPKHGTTLQCLALQPIRRCAKGTVAKTYRSATTQQIRQTPRTSQKATTPQTRELQRIRIQLPAAGPFKLPQRTGHRARGAAPPVTVATRVTRSLGTTHQHTTTIQLSFPSSAQSRTRPAHPPVKSQIDLTTLRFSRSPSSHGITHQDATTGAGRTMVAQPRPAPARTPQNTKLAAANACYARPPLRDNQRARR